MNVYTFRGIDFAVFVFFFSCRDQLLKERICSYKSKFFPLRVNPIFLKGYVIQGSIQESQKLFPFVKKWQKNMKIYSESSI